MLILDFTACCGIFNFINILMGIFFWGGAYVINGGNA